MKSGGKVVEERLADGLLVDPSSFTAGVGQETLVVGLEDSVAPLPEVEAGVLRVNIWLAQVWGQVKCQRSTAGGDVRLEEECLEHEEVVPGPGC